MDDGATAKLEHLLDPIAQLHGITDVLLIGADGLRVAARSQLPGDELDRMAASLSMLYALTDSAARYFGSRAVLHTAIGGAEGYLVLISADDQLLVAVVVDQTGDLETIIVEVCRAIDWRPILHHREGAATPIDDRYNPL